MQESKIIKIDPITRLEGHGKIHILLNKNGNVDEAYLQVVELRGFEKFCQGRPIEEMPNITTRICGVCPWNHHLASAKATDAVYKVDPPEAAKKIRELGYCSFFIHDHSTHFYALGGPDFIVGPGAPSQDRNIVGVLKKVGAEIGGNVLKALRYAHEIEEIVGGRAVHPVFAIPGGVSKALTDKECEKIHERARFLLDFSKFTVDTFEKTVLQTKKYADLMMDDTYRLRTYYMGTVDDKGKMSIYDGELKVIDPEGNKFAQFKASDYLKHISEHVEPWTYLKFPYLKNVGWKGLVDGKDSGIYRVGPLARFNVANGLTTPLAQAAYEKMFKTLKKPAHETLAYHWARVIETLYASERLLELIQDPDVRSSNVRTIPTATPEEGIGAIEAPRGTLIHHYKTDPEGIVQAVNLIVATTHNHGGICISVKKAAQGLIKKGKVNDEILNMVEMAFRAYDPCLACATHTLPGQMPLEICIYNTERQLVKRMSRL
jgi:F420-non-reducing hydrogenase large subunit